MITDPISRMFQKRLKVPEIKPNTIKGELSSSTINEIKNGKQKVTTKSEIILKASLNALYVDLISFSNKEVQVNNEYFFSFFRCFF